MNRDFKGIWIPREIWLRKDISIQEKSLWAEIHSLFDREKGGCYASNEYLCDFMDVKERQLQNMKANLKEKGMIVDVSNNGRQYIIKAILPPEDFSDCTSEVQDNAPQRCNNLHPRGAVSCTPPIYRDTSIDKRIVLPPIPPLVSEPDPAPPRVANATEVRVKPSKHDFSDQVKAVAASLIAILQLVKSDYRPPSNMIALLQNVMWMLETDNRSPEKIIEVFRWAVGDAFWSDKFFRPNPALYLRGKFDQLEMKMNAKPPAKERKFAPCSRQDVAEARAEEAYARSIT